MNTTLQQMAEAHLINVQREISNLRENHRKIEEEIKRLTGYFDEGVKTLNESKAAENVTQSQNVSSIFEG